MAFNASKPIPHLATPKEVSVATELSTRDFLKLLNGRHLKQHPGDTELSARIASYELAAKMQLRAAEVADLSKESAAIRALYGLDDANKIKAGFARNCVLARRLLERGVRFVQVWSGAGGPSNNWDNHTDIPKELPAIAGQVDRPAAALLQDLHDRGMLADTLLIWSTEFGRQPFTQGATGRDHNAGTSVAWLAGAGVKAGVSYGESDPWAWRAADGKAYCYDIHATILHLMGIDPDRLTYFYGGLDQKLVGVEGAELIQQLLA